MTGFEWAVITILILLAIDIGGIYKQFKEIAKSLNIIALAQTARDLRARQKDEAYIDLVAQKVRETPEYKELTDLGPKSLRKCQHGLLLTHVDYTQILKPYCRCCGISLKSENSEGFCEYCNPPKCVHNKIINPIGYYTSKAPETCKCCRHILPEARNNKDFCDQCYDFKG